MDSATENAPVQQQAADIIIIKRPAERSGHEHHGGAWKVAYADFVTAMMALFIVLWLMSTDDRRKKGGQSSYLQ